MGKPAAPKTYGKDFRLEHLPGWESTMASHQYTLKRDWQWSIRSDKAAHRWQIYFNAAEMGKPTLTFREARARLLAGIAGGFYEVSQ